MCTHNCTRAYTCSMPDDARAAHAHVQQMTHDPSAAILEYMTYMISLRSFVRCNETTIKNANASAQPKHGWAVGPQHDARAARIRPLGEMERHFEKERMYHK